MKTYWLISVVLLLNLSLLLINDYFPGTLEAIGIPVWLLFAIMAVMIVLSALSLKPDKEKHFLITFPVVSVIYPLLLLVVLTALGGESASGLSLTSPILWIGVIVTLAVFRRTYRKAQEEEAQQG
ncbi:hypothetical protein [Planococcus maitriensis]|uniref:Permease n=1 Tax=Planococcus maitriensis TaxID=221799 RepID=A0A365K8P8_9BACL|nr:hypothetical protein [Planococcus maitriensis]RAZ69155.1 hypothetical protein DP119_00375 [Planococcus maitriensis]